MQKKLPKIIVIEGFWGAGKSTLITSIRRKFPVLFIPEPNFLSAGIKSNISQWYKLQHKKRMDLAKTYIEYGEDTILERSILSSAAFYYAQHGSVPKWFNHVKSQLRTMSNLHILFLYKDKKGFLKNALDIKDKDVKLAISKHKEFYNNYLDFFTKVAPKLIGPKIICIKVSEKKQLPANTMKYLKKLLDNGPRHVKRKLEEIKAYCASAIIFYGDKFLLIYSKKHGHFSFPQGHRENGENLNQTVLREIKEETGFNDLEIITPIDTDDYRFYDKGKITRKIIKCFLVKLRSLKRSKKQFEAHESYTNHFFPSQNVLKKINWAEDKRMMMRAQEIISSNKKGPRF
jgi:bis(5'-nucleosidyl)-tetraphosphatase